MKFCKYALVALFAATLTLGIAGCGSSKDRTPPVLTLYEQPVGYVDEKYTITNARAEDETDGAVAVSMSLSSPSGAGIGLSNGSFTPHEAGTYKVTFTAQDKAGNVAKDDDEIVIRYRNGAPEITVGEYAAEAKEGDVYTLPDVRAEDAEGELPVSVTVIDPYGSRTEVKTGNSFLVEFSGKYYLRFTAVNSDGVSSEKVVSFDAAPTVKEAEGVDGVIDSRYDNAIQTYIGGFRELEKIGVRIARAEKGVYLAFDASTDTRVSRDESLELYFDKYGSGLSPTAESFRLDLRLDGSLVALNGPTWTEAQSGIVAYSKRPVAAVKLGQGTTLDAGNTDDNGYTAEVFVPYALIGVEADESFYMSLGCRREGDASGWDGWNEAVVFPDPQRPHTYVEITAAGKMQSRDRNYVDPAKADGRIDDAKYGADSAVETTVGGLRNLEWALVHITRDADGLYFAFDIPEDARVNDYDRVELYMYIGSDPGSSPEQGRSFGFFAQSNGGLSLVEWRNGWQTKYIDRAFPAYAATYYNGTTPNMNTDTDRGWMGELYIPYDYFNSYAAERVDRYSDFLLTFGIFRASAAEHHAQKDGDWGTDNTKDWDGWSQPDFVDPVIPRTYCYLTWDGQLVSDRDAVLNRLPEPTDPSVDGKLDEAYWARGATLELPKGADYDGLTATLYRDTEGLRVGFRGDVHKLTNRDAIVLYLSTKDSSYEIGGQGPLDDAYFVHGQYASIYDWMFQIHPNRAVTVYRGLYKDWADKVGDLSRLSLAVDLAAEGGYIAELYIPYAFLTASDGYKPTKDTTLGVSLRLVGENARGSLVWNNLRYAGIYCDSESPASYVRLDKDNKLFAATKNDAGYRVDGAFDEELYKGAHATLAADGSTAELWRGTDGIHAKVTFGTKDTFRLVLSTLGHGLGAPYVYDYLITVTKDGKVEGSAGNSHGFADPSLYVSYCAPRVIVKEGVAELFISYDWLSRYNTTESYTERGYMQITQESALRLAGEWLAGETKTACTYNGAAGGFDLNDPATYKEFVVQGA